MENSRPFLRARSSHSHADLAELMLLPLKCHVRHATEPKVVVRRPPSLLEKLDSSPALNVNLSTLTIGQSEEEIVESKESPSAVHLWSRPRHPFDILGKHATKEVPSNSETTINMKEEEEKLSQAPYQPRGRPLNRIQRRSFHEVTTSSPPVDMTPFLQRGMNGASLIAIQPQLMLQAAEENAQKRSIGQRIKSFFKRFAFPLSSHDDHRQDTSIEPGFGARNELHPRDKSTTGFNTKRSMLKKRNTAGSDGMAEMGSAFRAEEVDRRKSVKSARAKKRSSKLVRSHSAGELTAINTNKAAKDSSRRIVETSVIYAKSDKSVDMLYSPLGQIERPQGKVNQYHILRDIGHGSFGRVALVRHEESGIYHACKIISKTRLSKKYRWSLDEHQANLAIIQKEVAVIKKLSEHPNIVNLIEVLDDAKEDNIYMIFDLCEYGPVMNVSVGHVVKPFPEDVARSYFRDTVLGLEYLHYKRVIHRDLKPENLLLTADNIVQIGDFGISHIFDDTDDDGMLDPGNASPLFTPPEAFTSGSIPLNGRAGDIWSLGITLYCFVHGYCPFEDENVVELSYKIVHDELILAETLSPTLKSLLQKMLSKDPRYRINIAKIKDHPWVTNDGKEPMLSTEKNCVFEEVTEEEVARAFIPAIMLVDKMFHMFRNRKKSTQRGSSSRSRVSQRSARSTTASIFGESSKHRKSNSNSNRSIDIPQSTTTSDFQSGSLPTDTVRTRSSTSAKEQHPNLPKSPGTVKFFGARRPGSSIFSSFGGSRKTSEECIE